MEGSGGAARSAGGDRSSGGTSSGGAVATGGLNEASGGVPETGAGGAGIEPEPGWHLEGDPVEVPGDHCGFLIQHGASPAIATVQRVDWSTDLQNVIESHLEFGPSESPLDMRAPVPSGKVEHQTLLLGMKGNKSYSFRIVAQSEAVICTSPVQTFMTGAVPDWVPQITKTEAKPEATRGFVVTTPGFRVGAFTLERGLPSAYIFDTDGDVVWWSPHLTEDTTAAHLSWDGQHLWYLKLNLGAPSPSGVFRVSMDGMTVVDETAGIEGAHHDFTVLPEGGIAVMVEGQNGERAALVEKQADGTVIVIKELEDLYQDGFHPNAVHYYPADKTFTLSDLVLNGFVKFKRSGELLWQLGGEAPLGSSFELLDLEPWGRGHGHHLTADGRFLFFKNLGDAGSEAVELLLDEQNWTVTKTWEYAGGVTSQQLGDVERLPSGNVLITYSNPGKMQEVSPEGEVLQAFDNSASFETMTEGYAVFGYADFRTSLYGPPPR